MKKVIGVIGAGHEDASLNALAEETGRLIARANAVLVNGGLFGVMQASSKGAKAEGGTTVGLLPGLDPKAANPYIDIAVPTGLGEGRNLLIVRAADALIAIGGGYGTLSEIALGLKTGKPVVGLSTWDVSDDVAKAGTPEEAVHKALGFLNR